MSWKGISKNCLSSDEGYLVSRYAVAYALTGKFVYVARTPAPASKILYSGENEKAAKAACVTHLESKMGTAA